MPTKNNRDDDQSTINNGKSPYRNQMFNNPLIAQTTQTMMSLSYARLKIAVPTPSPRRVNR